MVNVQLLEPIPWDRGMKLLKQEHAKDRPNYKKCVRYVKAMQKSEEFMEFKSRMIEKVRRKQNRRG
jgi:hypothetical protein